jgi:hypothetical protein
MRLSNHVYHSTGFQYKLPGGVSSVSIETRLWPARPGHPGFIQDWERIFSALHVIQTALEPTHHHMLWLPGNPPLVVEHLSIQATHSAAFNAETKLLGTVPPFPHTSSWRDLRHRMFGLEQIGNILTKTQFYYMCLKFCVTESNQFYYGFILRLAL